MIIPSCIIKRNIFFVSELSSGVGNGRLRTPFGIRWVVDGSIVREDWLVDCSISSRRWFWVFDGKKMMISVPLLETLVRMDGVELRRLRLVSSNVKGVGKF